MSKIRLATVFTGASAGASADVGMQALRAPGGQSAVFYIPTSANADRVRYLGVHEFGHILGFSHEQDSPDNWSNGTAGGAPLFCRQTGAPSLDGIQLDTYDQNSIMNYCGNHLNNTGTLSDGDRRGIQQVYGPESVVNVSPYRSGTNQLHVFMRGTNGQLLWSLNGADFASLGGNITGTPTVTSLGGVGSPRVDVFTRGSYGQLLQRTFSGSVWGDWIDLGGIFSEDVTAVSWGAGRLDVFGRGTDGIVYSRSWVAGGWTSSWASLGGPIIGKPKAFTRGTNNIDLFVQGTDNALYRKIWNGSSWSGFLPVGSEMFGEPVISQSARGFEVVARDSRTGQIKHRSWNASTNSWTPSASTWRVLDGMATEVPALVALPDGSTSLYVRGTDLRLYSRSLVSGVWNGWQNNGGALLGSPRAEANGTAVWARGSDERVHVFATYWNTVGTQKMSW